MTTTVQSLTCILAFAIVGPALAQTFDNSGNGSLKGDYFVRQVITANLDPMTGAIGRAVSLTGVMTFDGQGKYSFTGQIMDSTTGSSATPYAMSGVYSAASNGLVQVQNPIDATDTERGAVTGLGPLAIVASATEGKYHDLFVAIAAGSSASNSSVSGSYQAAFIDFLQGNVSQVRDGRATLTSTGTGGFGNITVSGAMANETNTDVQQIVNAVTYSVSGKGSGTFTFPTSSTPLAALLSGQKTLYVSSDGNLLLAGDPNGFDIFVGVKSISGAASNSMYQGTYFSAGLENGNAGNGFNIIDSFYGSTFASGAQATGVAHFRNDTFSIPTNDFTTNISFNFASDGTYSDPNYHHQLAANGLVDLQTGVAPFYSLTLNIAAPITAILVPANAGVISPTKIFNAANYAPITNPVAPGEFVTIFGSNLAASAQSAGIPLPKSLGGVQATVNGRPAPISYVSPTQVNIVIPYATTEFYATLQLSTNGVPSNKVTLYNNVSAPGVFTLTNNDGTFAPGIGPAAVLHADNSLVTADNPANAGETLQLYVTGLGPVTTAVADGASAPSNPPAMVNDKVSIKIIDKNFAISKANVAFAGLAPGFAGLYQINFVVPSGLASGTAFINVSTTEGTTSEALLYTE